MPGIPHRRGEHIITHGIVIMLKIKAVLLLLLLPLLSGCPVGHPWGGGAHSSSHHNRAGHGMNIEPPCTEFARERNDSGQSLPAWGDGSQENGAKRC